MSLKESVEITLRSAGFLSDSGDPVEGLIDIRKAREEIKVFLRHGRILGENHQEAKIDLIYEIPSTLKGNGGHTCIYFKNVEEISEQQIQQIRKDVWNSGRASILWLIKPTEIRIYNAFARPIEEDTAGEHILDALNITSQGIKGIEQFRRELFDTGQFWESGKGQNIDLNQRVERSLLDDLWDTERILTHGEGRIPVHVAHAILGRCIFMTYLWDRKIITPKFLKKKFGCDDIKALFNNKRQLYNFFDWLREAFNGDLFPIDEDERKTPMDHPLEIIRLFFNGTDMNSIKLDENNKVLIYQERLWPYSFDIIPIELISSIYEMFAHSKNPIEARTKSVHYTKLHLVELVQSLAMLDLSDDARILDPACGSGVFLVDAFRRLVLKRRIDLGRKLTHDEILDILLTQIYGVDIEPGAIEVTAFSLYLALLELDEDLNDPETIKFPKLIYPGHEEGYSPTLYTQDICNWGHDFNRNEPFKSLKFDLIVGNLPWTELNKNTAPRDPEKPESGRQWIYDYIVEHNIPSKNPDQAIMKRVRDFARPDTRIAVIVASRIFYQWGKDDFWLNSFLKDNCIYMVINLTDLANERILFGSKDIGDNNKPPVMPGSVIFYNPQPPKKSSTVTYICPKWYPTINRREVIIIHPPDIQTISLSLLQDYPYLWKIAFRGSQRDFELIKSLIENSSLSLKDALHEIGINDTNYCRGYIKGNRKKDASKYFGLPNLEWKGDYKYSIESKDLPRFQYEKLEAPRVDEIYKAPVLIFRRSLKKGETRVALTSEDTVYSTTYFGISFNGIDERYAHRLNAIFNSKFTLYLAFMLGRELGWFKRLIEDRDWLNMPLPKSFFDLEDDKWNETIEIGSELSKVWKSAPSSTIKDLENSLFRSVCELYELNEEERIIVVDTINYAIDHFLNRKRVRRLRSITYPTSNQLQKYANRLCKQLNGLLELEGKKLIYQLYDLENFRSLTVVEFQQKSQEATQTNELKKIKGMEEALIELSENMRKEITGRIYAWAHLRVYEGECLYIIKPSEERFWTESSALNDADEIIKEHMGSQYGVS